MNAKRLLDLARFLDELPRAEFDFADVVTEQDGGCGSVCCAVGWTPRVFPELVEWCQRGDYDLDVTMRNTKWPENGYILVGSCLFDITRDEATALFTPGYRRPWAGGAGPLHSTATPKQVAASIREFVGYRP